MFGFACLLLLNHLMGHAPSFYAEKEIWFGYYCRDNNMLQQEGDLLAQQLESAHAIKFCFKLHTNIYSTC